MSTPRLNGELPGKESIYNTQDAASETTSDLQALEDLAQSSAASFYVDYETRDGSAKNGKDYHSLKGTLVNKYNV